MALAGCGGVGEAVYRTMRQVWTHRPAAHYYWELVWMAPLSAALGGAVVGVALAVAALIMDGLAARPVTILLGFIAVYPVLQLEGIPLHWSAEVLLSLGLAVVMADVVSKRMDGLDSFLIRARRPIAGALVGLTLVGAVDHGLSNERLALAGRDDAPRGVPNILLIILDTVRAADLSLYGYQRATTPWLTRWARSGIVFEQAYSTAPWTLPSHASLLTGHYANELSTGFSQPLDSRFTTLSEILGSEGYVSVGFAANMAYTSRMSGLQRGFDRYESIPIDGSQLAQSSWLSLGLVRHTPGAARLFDLGRRSAADIAQTFLEWDAHRPRRPFFAFLNFFDAHAPYEPPSKYREMFGPPPQVTWDDVFNTWGLYPDSIYGPEQVEAWRGRYDGAIRYIDDRLSLMFDSLEARGTLDNTIVVVAGDHGEMWGENGQIEHATSVYAPLLHVPLVVSFPGRIPKGRRVTAKVSLRDVPSTILDLAGLSAEASMPGSSLRSTWDGSAQRQKPSVLRADLGLYPEDVVGWAPGVVNWAPATRGPMLSLIEGSLHYILSADGTEELYDIDRDPAEAVDLAAGPEGSAGLVRFRSLRDSLR